MSRLRIAALAGDGVGPEVVTEAVLVLEQLSAEGAFGLEIEAFPFSADHYLKTGETLPLEAFERMERDFDAILVGAFGDPRVPSNRHADEILLGLRRRLDLFANVRPARCLAPRLCPLAGKTERDIDFVVVRENTEGAYLGLGGTFREGQPEEMAIEEDVSTRHGVARVLRFAFSLAAKRDRKSLAMADKHNVQKHGGGLWKRAFDAIAPEFSEVSARHVFADAAAMELVQFPERYSVLVTNNLFGDLLSDVGAALVGGPGFAPSGSVAPGKPGLYEPVHGSATALAGKDLANPAAAILSVALLLHDHGFPELSQRVERAVSLAVAAGETTGDAGGALGTRAAGAAIRSRLA